MATREMYIIDPEGIAQQVTIKNIAVGRSVLEALKLVEAFKVCADKDVLCPGNWKSGEDTLAETYEDQEHDIIRHMGDVQIRDLDNKTPQPFDLVMTKHIEVRHKHTISAPVNESPTTQSASHSRSSPHTSTTHNSKRNSAGHTTNNLATLEFSDPLAQPQGSSGTADELAAMVDPSTAGEGKKSGSKSPEIKGVQKH